MGEKESFHKEWKLFLSNIEMAYAIMAFSLNKKMIIFRIIYNTMMLL